MLIDLRSDTATRPSANMLKAMLDAAVGDDVFSEDETVIRLQEKTATMFGKEAGLFCPSGTMTNQIAIKVHTQPGDEVLCDVSAHIYNYEVGGIAFNSSAQAKLIHGDRGRITAEQVLENINLTYDWLAHTSLVSIENTSNRSGGSFYEMSEIKKIAEVCKANNLKFHLDGARIFNALIEMPYKTGVSENEKINQLALEMGSHFDSVSVCLSKGLGAPVGSVLLGTQDFIKKARRVRKVFGGGMRQAGYLAAAGIYALDNNIALLKNDHARARQIGETLSKLSYVESVMPVDTNIIIFTLTEKINAEDFVKKLRKHNIVTHAFGKQKIRFVTHLDFTDDMLAEVLNVLKNI